MCSALAVGRLELVTHCNCLMNTQHMNRIDGGLSDCALVMQGLHLPATHTSRGREWKRKNFARSHTSSQKAEFILKDHLPGNLSWGLQTGGPLPTDGLCSKRTQVILIDWSPRCFSAPQTSRKKKRMMIISRKCHSFSRFSSRFSVCNN